MRSSPPTPNSPRRAAQGAREELKKHGFKLIFDKSYPPNTTDFTPVMRAVQAANADIVYAGAYPPDSVGLVRAANEIGLNPKIFGGALIGQLVTPIKVQLGPMQNGIVIHESFVPSPKLNFPGLDELMKRYQAKARRAEDRLRSATPSCRSATPTARFWSRRSPRPRASTTMCSPNTSTATASRPWSASISFGKDGEWAKPRMVLTQFQNIEPNNVDQFKNGDHQPILWPPEYKSGEMIYPYENARKK